MKLKKLAACLIAAILLISSLSVAFAAREGSLLITVTDEADDPVANFKLGLCKVAESDGVLFTEYSPSGISASSMRNEKNNARNAKKLLPFAKQMGGDVRITDVNGNAGYDQLSEGIYLVFAPEGQGYIFTPFLVYMPTIIGGVEHYELLSEPKVEDETTTPPGGGGGIEPTPTPTPTPGDEPTPSPTPTPGDEPEPSDPPAGPTPPGGGEGGEGGEDPNVPTPPGGGGEGGEGGEDPYIPTLPLTGVERRPIWILLGLGGALIIAGVLQLCIRRKTA